MKINDSYEVSAVDERTIAVLRRRVSKKGTPEETVVWNPIAYFSSVKDALRYFVRYEINGTGLKDLVAVYEKVNELENLILTFYSRTCDEVLFNERLEQVKEQGIQRQDVILKRSTRQRRSPPVETPADTTKAPVRRRRRSDKNNT